MKTVDDSPAEPPTHIRWRILALLMAFAWLCHFNRVSISVAGTEAIMPQYGIDETSMGAVYSAYLVAYTLCMMPAGWLIDRIGPRTALSLMGFGSAVIVPLTGLTGLFTAGGSVVKALFVIRGSLGAVSAPMHPGAARAVSLWIPYRGRAAANGLVTGSALLGIASTYFAFGFLIDRCGWPRAFMIEGIVTLVVAILWAMTSTGHPREHPLVNLAELRLIADGDPEQTAPAGSSMEPTYQPINASRSTHRQENTGHPERPSPFSSAGAGEGAYDLAVPDKSNLLNRSLVLLTLSYAAVSYFQYLFFYWMQFYFDKVLAFGKDEGRLYATIPTVAMAVGMILGGWLTDRVIERAGRRRGRAIFASCGMLASALFLGVGAAGRGPLWVVGFFALSMGAIGLCESSFWTCVIELGGRRGGFSAAILNTGGNAGGLLAPFVTPLLSKYFGWQAGLGLAAIFCIAGATLWYWIDPDEQSG